MGIIKKFIVKVMICVLIVLGIMIICKKNNDFKNIIYKNVYENNISFGYLNTLYKNYLGDIIPFKLDVGTTPVFNANLVYKSSNSYNDGCQLVVDTNYLVPSLDAGLVIFVGEKEGYGNTIIVEQSSGIEVWYGNISNVSVNLYDYIEKGTYLGNTIDDKLYLVFKQDGNILNYEDYI